MSESKNPEPAGNPEVMAALREENERLKALISWRKTRDAVVARLISRIRNTPDLPVIFQITARDIGEALEADRCEIQLDIDQPLIASIYEYSTIHPTAAVENAAVRPDLRNGEEPLNEIAAPITLQHELLGVITVQKRRAADWSSGEIELVHHVAGELAVLLANARLILDNQARQREISELRAIAKISLEASDPYSLARQLGEHAARLVHAEQVLVGLIRGELIVVEHYSRHGRWQAVDLQFRPGEGIAGWVLIHARPYVSHHVRVDPQIDPDYLHRFDLRNVLAVPILSGHRVLGVIELHNRRDQPRFTDEDVSHVETIAHQAALALERSQLFDEIERRANALETLLAVSAELNEHLNPDLLIRHLVEHATSLVGATAGLGGLVRPEGLVTQGYWRAGKWLPFEHIWIDSGLASWVEKHKRPYLTNDYRHDEAASRPLIDRFDVRSSLCVPITNAQDQILGFLEVHDKDGGRIPFSWADVGLMESLANAAAVAIGNTYLFKELDQRGAQLRALSAQLVTLLEDERQRIARELHDEAGQALIGIKLNLQVLARKIPESLPILREEVNALRQEVNQATRRLQAISRGLRPPTLDELGLLAALNRLSIEFEQNTGIPINLEMAVQQTRLPQPIEIACYRIVQESLTNVVRHANASQIWVKLDEEERVLTLRIKDNGDGFQTPGAEPGGLGLLGMRERATILGGQLSIDSAPGKGTEIQVIIPINNPRPIESDSHSDPHRT